jgi:hypothetical protein
MKKFETKIESEELTNYITSLSSVTGERVDGHALSAQNITSYFVISARPAISYVRPDDPPIWGDDIPIARVGFECKIRLTGYNFEKSIAVYLSAGTGVYTTNALSGKSEFDLFTNTRSLSSHFPAFSGLELGSDKYRVLSPNLMWINIPATQAVGFIDIIIANKGGYGTLYGDNQTRIVNVKS